VPSLAPGKSGHGQVGKSQEQHHRDLQPTFQITAFIFNNIPVRGSNVLYYQQHSRFRAIPKSEVLYFQRDSRIVVPKKFFSSCRPQLKTDG
jgi:hypothetical protein